MDHGFGVDLGKTFSAGGVRRRRQVATVAVLLATTVLTAGAAVKAALPATGASTTGGSGRPATGTSAVPGGYEKVGYLTQWGIYQDGFTPRSVDAAGQAAKLTTINYAYAGIRADGRCFESNTPRQGDANADYQRPFDPASSVDGEADVAGQPLNGNFNQLKKLKAKYPQLKVLISIGGWSYSKYFSDVALTDASRRAFVSSCIDLFIKGNLPQLDGNPAGGPGSAAGVFDGIDIDWRWPGGGGAAGNTVRPQDKQNLTLLLAEFRRQLDAHGSTVGRRYALSAFLPADPAQIAGLQLPQVFASLDWATVQGYDFHGPWEPTTNHQANLYPPAGDPAPAKRSGDLTISTYLAGHAPARRLLLGLPFYGRGWSNVPSTRDGLFQPGRPATGRYGAGTEDYVTLRARPGTRHLDNVAGALWHYDGTTWWSYDDPRVIALKTAYVRLKGLGGVSAWELHGDDGTLTAAIDSGLR